MSCECGSEHFIMTDGFNTCQNCGVITSQMEYLNGVENYVEPLQMCVYQRKKRFEEMLKKIVYPHPERKDELVLAALHGRTFDNTEDLITFLKQTGIKDKRYQSIHAFVRLYCKDYKKVNPLTHDQRKRCVRIFEEIEYRFTKHPKKIPFFNYMWVMEQILHHIGVTRFDPYLKKIKCKKRNAYYSELFTTLCTMTSTPGGVLHCL